MYHPASQNISLIILLLLLSFCDFSVCVPVRKGQLAKIAYGIPKNDRKNAQKQQPERQRVEDVQRQTKGQIAPISILGDDSDDSGIFTAEPEEDKHLWKQSPLSQGSSEDSDPPTKSLKLPVKPVLPDTLSDTPSRSKDSVVVGPDLERVSDGRYYKPSINMYYTLSPDAIFEIAASQSAESKSAFDPNTEPPAESPEEPGVDRLASGWLSRPPYTTFYNTATQKVYKVTSTGKLDEVTTKKGDRNRGAIEELSGYEPIHDPRKDPRYIETTLEWDKETRQSLKGDAINMMLELDKEQGRRPGRARQKTKAGVAPKRPQAARLREKESKGRKTGSQARSRTSSSRAH